MEIAIVILSAAFIAAAITAISFGAKLEKERRHTARLRCDIECAMNIGEAVMKDREDLRLQLANESKTASALSQKIGDLKATNERLVDKCNAADVAITTACLALNNFKGNSKVVDEARNVLKKYITEVNK